MNAGPPFARSEVARATTGRVPRRDRTRLGSARGVAALVAIVLGVAGGWGLGRAPVARSVRADEPPVGSARALSACLRSARCDRTFLVAHRGRGFGAPENSVDAVARALAHGIQAVKVDLRASRDGEVFVLHDPTLDRTTDQRGAIARYTAAELGTARLVNGEPLPRFADLYRRFAGRALFVLDCKVDVIERVAGWLARRGSLDDAVFLVGSEASMRTLARVRGRYPELMVAARLVNWWDLPVIWEIFGGPPTLLHTDLTTPADLAEVRRRASGVKVFAKALDMERRVWPFGERALQGLVDARPTLILTDDPLRLQPRIREWAVAPRGPADS